MTFKELLKKRGMTQEQLAKRLKVTQSTVSQWCKSITAPQRRIWKRVAQALEVSVEELLECFEK